MTELVELAVERAPDAVRTDPDRLAAAIVDLALDKGAGPGRSEVADLVGPLWTAEHTRRVLNISRSAMLGRRRTGSVLALRAADDAFVYPVTQFEKRDGKTRVKPGLRDFMMMLRDQDPWTVAVLIHTPAPELDDSTPLDWVRAGRETERLVDYAELLRTGFGR